MPFSGKKGEFCWNRLMTQDVHAAKRFYHKLFGWELHRPSVSDLPISVFRVGEKEVAGLMETPIGLEEAVGPHWLSFIAVDDIHLTVSNAVELGATVNLPVKSIGTSGHIAVILDPTGARIGLWQASEEIY